MPRDPYYTCPFCPETTSDIQEMTNHVESEHAVAWNHFAGVGDPAPAPPPEPRPEPVQFAQRDDRDLTQWAADLEAGRWPEGIDIIES